MHNVMCASLATFSSDHSTMDAHGGMPGATGSNHQQVRVMSSMPAKKRLAVKYRDMVPGDGDSKLPTFEATSNHSGDPLPTEKSVDDHSIQAGDR